MRRGVRERRDGTGGSTGVEECVTGSKKAFQFQGNKSRVVEEDKCRAHRLKLGDPVR